MPRLNTLGDAATGVGNIAIGINGATPAALAGILGGEPRWFRTTPSKRIIFQNNTAGDLSFYDLTSLAVTSADPAGENRLGAGGSVWAAFLTSTGTRTNVAGLGPFPAAALGDVSETGQVAINTSYSTGMGLQVYAASGVGLWALNPTLTGGTTVRCKDNYTAFSDENGWHIWKNSPPALQSFTEQIDTSIVTVTPVVSGSNVLVLEGGNRLTLRRKDSQQGYIITTGFAFNPDVIELTPGVVRIAWSLTSGEAASDLVVMDLTLASGANLLGTVVAGALVFVAGTPIKPTAMPGTPKDAGIGTSQLPFQHPVINPKNGLMTPEWQAALQNVSTQLSSVSAVNPNPTPFTPPGPIASGAAYYLVSQADPTLANARDVLDSPTVTWDFSVANVAKANAAALATGIGTGFPGLDGEDGETFVIPGPQGQTGAAGATGPSGANTGLGPPGMDGEDADMLFIPGPAGSAGATGASGALTLLEQHTASTSTSLTITTAITSTYDEYILELVNLVAETTNVSLRLRCSTDGGSTYDSGSNYDTALLRFSSSGTGSSGGTTATSIDLTGGATINNTAAEGGLCGAVRVFDPLNASQHKRFVGQTSYRTTTPAYVGIQISGSYKVVTAVNALELTFSSGHIVTGTIRIYGIEK